MRIGKQQTGSVNVIIVGALLLFVAIGVFVFLQNSGDEEADVAQVTGDTNQQDSQSVSPVDVQDGERINEAAARLVFVGSGDQGSTSAYGGTTDRWESSGVFGHEVIANLPDAPEGKFYEGWLVGSTVVSTGRLINEFDDQWSLLFESQDLLLSHDQVVITEETEENGLDGKPERHVLEGSF